MLSRMRTQAWGATLASTGSVLILTTLDLSRDDSTFVRPLARLERLLETDPVTRARLNRLLETLTPPRDPALSPSSHNQQNQD